MTENKRFILADIGFVYDNEKLIGMKDIVEVMNILHEENQKLFTLSNMKKGVLVEAIKDLTEENEQLKKEIHELNQRNNQVLAYNSACEDTLLNVELVLHRLIDKCCSNNNDDTVSICEVLQEFKKEIFPSLIQPEIKPILGPVGRCVPNPFEIKKENPKKF